MSHFILKNKPAMPRKIILITYAPTQWIDHDWYVLVEEDNKLYRVRVSDWPRYMDELQVYNRVMESDPKGRDDNWDELYPSCATNWEFAWDEGLLPPEWVEKLS